MKNRVKLRTIIIIAAVYFWGLIYLYAVGGSIFAWLAVFYCIAAMAGGYTLLGWDIAATAHDSQTFQRIMPLRNLGSVLIDFQHIFFHEQDILPEIIEEINNRTLKQGFFPELQKRNYTDHDKNLLSPDTRVFFVASSEANRHGSEVALAVKLYKNKDSQSIQWWILMRGLISRNKKVALLARSPLALPFWLWSYLRQKLDLVSSVRTAYDSFYNSIDIVTYARGVHTLVFNALVDTLDKHGVDISDLKLQRAQVMNINITGGRATFGNIVQALQQARVVQTGGPK